MNYFPLFSVKSGQTDGQTDRRTDRQTDRQTESDAYEPPVQLAQVGSNILLPTTFSSQSTVRDRFCKNVIALLFSQKQ